MLPEVNLLPKYERKESVLYNVFIIGLIIIILLTVLLGYFYFTTNSKLDTVEQNVALLNDEKATLEARLAAVDTSDEGISLSEVVAYVERHHVPTSVLVDEFMELLPEHGYLSHFAYNYNTVNIETQFETVPASSTYIADLTESPYLNEVVINSLYTFDYGTEEEGIVTVDEDALKEIPRYNVDYSMEVNHQALAEEGEE